MTQLLVAFLSGSAHSSALGGMEGKERIRTALILGTQAHSQVVDATAGQEMRQEIYFAFGMAKLDRG